MFIFSDILGILINVITDFIFYFIDAEREKKGLPSNYRFYEDSLSGGGMNFVEFYRYDLEKIKSTEDQFANEKRLKYVYKDNNAAMDNIAANGTIEPKKTENSIIMDEI